MKSTEMVRLLYALSALLSIALTAEACAGWWYISSLKRHFMKRTASPIINAEKEETLLTDPKIL
jgi:hypothetical protein